jgi:molybdate transport system regulatory protein
VNNEIMEGLGLKKGDRIFAMVKDTDIILSTGKELRTSARNNMKGRIAEVREGEVNATVHLELPGGTILLISITRNSVNSLGLEEGMEATALFKASSVILGMEA